MNEKNYEFLSNQLKYTGFGEEHAGHLKAKMALQTPEFTIFHQADFGKDNVVATLQFRRSDETDMYFFNRYNMILKNAQHPDTIKQTFYIHTGQDNISFKEAYNLMSGRAVHKELSTKEGEKYKAWVQLDFKDTDSAGNFKMKQFHENYGYDLDKALATHPIREMQDETGRERLIASLERGNRQAVTLVIDGKESRIFVDANPQYKTVNLYDQHQKRVSKQSLSEGREPALSAGSENKATQKQVAGKDEDGESVPAAKQRRKKKQGIA